MSDGAVVALYLKPGAGRLDPVVSLQAEAGKGFIGDRHFGAQTRQVSLVDVECLTETGYHPGDLREHITFDAPGFRNLANGENIRVGEVVLQIEQPCEPCAGLARRLHEDPGEFIRKMRGRRGLLAKVITSGTIRIGDSVVKIDG